ncbi:polysaccharide biosynthesis tyrosine autokinase [Rubripirellula amarantea]|uniref:non-specific protein-tyrosine kinase n=1 Tax=Rubripirellula amarantea TaxID=2527999 RepID=A0A5C5WHS2_9BACT|nr:polysaccharide biosynthesis tyrosine autokinase [Rubripirellula amarantea]MDA8743875.1 polysaccharide biosynthesis tyrosine autokinase [Rubripirellula amarantea]TWT49635.1 Tyrosine-protein kinase YwqD [Rubripirellula amarantea]
MATSTENTSLRTQLSNRLSSDEDNDGLEIFAILSRQRWLIGLLTLAGLAVGLIYALNAEVWYRSQAKVLINEKSAGLGAGSAATDIIDEDILANHMELLQSRLIVGEALESNGLMNLESITPHLGDSGDPVEYVIDRLELVKGGDGSAKTARSLNIALTHTDPEDTQLILTAVLKRYEQFIINQVEQVMGRANEMVNKAKTEVETDLVAAEQEYLTARQEAPLFFQGEGSSNIYQDRYRRLQEQLLDIDIQESTIRTRLERVEETLSEMDEEKSTAADQLDKLALIDSESLERLGVFAGLQMNSANTAEFRAAMPAQTEKARAEITHLLQLNSEKQRLTAVFGPGHPKVQDIQSEIESVKAFLQENDELAEPAAMFADSTLTPTGLLRAYVGFLNHDMSALNEQRKELTFLAADAEEKAKALIEYELKDLVLQKKISRQEALFDGVVQQLRDLDTASGLSGYLYEFLEVPRLGKKSWPKLPICGLGGLMLGLFSGLVLAVANEVRDRRFRSASELDEAIGLPNLGMVAKLNSIREGISGLIAAENSPNAEAFRLGRTVLLPEIRSGELRVLGFTSPMQGDGKSTVTSNFAVSFSQIGLKVLVIDADLRRPSVHRYFSVAKGAGLCDVLEGREQFKDMIRETEAEGVHVVTAGSSPKMAAELLQSDKLDEVIAEAREMYDLVLVDLPPVLAVSDPIVVMPRLDGGVLVVRVSRVRRDEVINTMRRIESSGGNFVGCMLNAFGAGKKFNVEGGYYGYYRSDYSRPASKNGSSKRIASPARASSIPTDMN